MYLDLCTGWQKNVADEEKEKIYVQQKIEKVKMQKCTEKDDY